MLGGKKQILIVGNDGAQLYLVSGKKISLYGDFLTSSETLTDELRTAFSAVKAPLLVLLDVVEQQYRKETIPSVGKFDRTKVIQRKLLMAFPQQEMRAFLPLTQKPGDAEGLTLLFAALSVGPVIEKIMAAILGSEIFVSGVGLLPLESTSLVNKMVQLTHDRAKISNDTRWSILMTYHKTGGLRQIVVKDGELALTRLTPLSANPNDARALTEEMSREFNSTLIYLSRFGYIPTDGLDLIVVSSAAVCQHFRQLPLPVTHLYPLTQDEACQLLGVTPTGTDSFVFSDIIHAVWGGLQRKVSVPLTAPIVNKVKSIRQGVRAAIILLFLASCYLLYENTTLQADAIALQSDIVEQQSKKQVLQHQAEELKKTLNTLKYDPEKIATVLSLGNAYAKKTLDVEPTLQLLVATIDHSKARIKEITIEPPLMTDAQAQPTPAAASTDPASAAGAVAAKPAVVIHLTMGFTPGLPIEDAAVATNDFAVRLQKQLPNHKVVTDKIVGDLAVDKMVKGTSEQAAQGKVEGNVVDDEVSTFNITGALQ